MTVVNHVRRYMKVVVEGRQRCCSKCGDVAFGGYYSLIDKRDSVPRDTSLLVDPCSSLVPRELSLLVNGLELA